MKEFAKYQHIERFGHDKVADINLGLCHIFSKIDGANASVWLGDDGKIHAGSRKKELSEEFDNHGFYKYITQDKRIRDLLNARPELRLFGEWLVPHTLKIYRFDAWRKFYVFDVTYFTPEMGIRHMPYDIYKDLLDQYELDYLAPIAIIKNPTYDRLVDLLDKTMDLIEDGKGPGEGIVIKNYDFINQYGRTTWAKIVRAEFKEEFHKAMGPPNIKEKGILEENIARDYITEAMVDKVYANIVNEQGEWKSQYIPRLLSTVFHDLVNEEIWTIIKKYKNPTIHFDMLLKFTILVIKSLKSDLFLKK